MNLKQILAAFKSPQGAISVITTVVTVLGTVGLLNTGLSTALEALLTAVLGVVMAVTHTTVTASLIRRAVTSAEQPAPAAPVAPTQLHRREPLD